jgi:hypothetical protein
MTDSNATHPTSSPPTISMSFARPWSILRPRVYRYLETQYVEAFFRDGSLRLSSFARFAEHPDEQRKDTTEGMGARFGIGSHATINWFGGRGHDHYVLCGTIHNTKNVRDQFKQYDACMAIDNVTAFANAVASAIPYFKGGTEGMVIYQDDTTRPRNALGRDNGAADQYARLSCPPRSQSARSDRAAAEMVTRPGRNTARSAVGITPP